MLYIGFPTLEEQRTVAEYQVDHDIRKTYVIAPERFPLPVPGADQVDYDNVITYVTFYRLLQEIDPQCLVVIHECLRTQNRYDLAYNCIRNYLNHTPHVLVFQTLPQIDTAEDFMILFDFVTESRWKRRPFDPALIQEHARVHVRPYPLTFRRLDVPTAPTTQQRYAAERDRLFADLGAKDPHTLPRNLYLIGGRDKLAYIRAQQLAAQPSLFADDAGPARHYVARNQRLADDAILSYADVDLAGGPYTILEFPHRFIDWCDFVSYTGQAANDILVADLPVDRWYYDRYTAWKERMDATYASLRP